jgi:hypothetical protein
MVCCHTTKSRNFKGDIAAGLGQKTVTEKLDSTSSRIEGIPGRQHVEKQRGTEHAQCVSINPGKVRFHKSGSPPQKLSLPLPGARVVYRVPMFKYIILIYGTGTICEAPKGYITITTVHPPGRGYYTIITTVPLPPFPQPDILFRLMGL